ncbi:pyridoxal phosphate-dependent aminotransferase [Bengtsoniella intestinalis]|uniref:pyridoxal phosphate-dependent aminotransferase n=1 Tax=Bengtsoniella intestinalis TaxID=3073143 RepID=UPI00391F7207
MVSQQMYALGSNRSCIRDLFEYGLQQAALIGAENVYDYSIGNPSVPAPEAVGAAFAATIAQKNTVAVHSYTSATGINAVREAVSSDLNARFGTSLQPEHLFFTCGAAPALIAVLRALAVENAEFVAIAPFFPEYRPFVEGTGSKFVLVEADTATFQISTTALEAAITPNTQAVMVNTPNNPSGVVYTRETLEELAALLGKKSAQYGHPIYIIADEPYRELVYDGVEVPFIPTIYKDTIVCYSYSKSLSLPGERIGYICIGADVADSAQVMAAVAGASRVSGHVCAPSLQQLVVAQCATVRPDLTIYDQNRQTLYTALTGYGYECVYPKGAFYMLVKAPEGSGAAFSKRAMGKNLLLVPGDDFGIPEYVRICTCVSPEMIQRSLPAFEALAKETV